MRKLTGLNWLSITSIVLEVNVCVILQDGCLQWLKETAKLSARLLIVP
jgi:hypothetical protein